MTFSPRCPPHLALLQKQQRTEGIEVDSLNPPASLNMGQKDIDNSLELSRNLNYSSIGQRFPT